VKKQRERGTAKVMKGQLKKRMPEAMKRRRGMGSQTGKTGAARNQKESAIWAITRNS